MNTACIVVKHWSEITYIRSYTIYDGSTVILFIFKVKTGINFIKKKKLSVVWSHLHDGGFVNNNIEKPQS